MNLPSSYVHHQATSELQMKANELEMLFAQHKLRVTYTSIEQVDVKSLKRIAEYGGLVNSRGLLYDRYMEKRDAKLREESGVSKAQKEAKMRAMHESLERSRAEMKARFAGSSATNVCPPESKLRSFRRSSTTMKEQQHMVESSQSENDEDLSEIRKQTQFGRSTPERVSRDGSSRGSNMKKLITNKSMSPSIPRILPAPVPRPFVKSSNAGSSRLQTQVEAAIVLPISNYPDYRKESTKLSFGSSKTMNRSLTRNYARSRSTSEGLHLVKEDTAKRPQSMRSSSVNPIDYKESSPLKIPKINDSKPFLKKGNGIGPGVGAGIAKIKASIATENLYYEEETSEPTHKIEDLVDIVKLEGEAEAETTGCEETMQYANFIPESHNESSRLSQESNKSVNPGLEVNTDSLSRKWVSDQTAVIVANASQHHFQKDVPKGFKRLLMFGRRTRVSGIQVDLTSTTNSEGSDDVEDGCIGNHPSENLWKSKIQVQAIGSYIPSPPANYTPKEANLSGSSLKAPRSFFALSSFRIRGNESKAK
ncbi:hypothetical protein GIB67_040793 [Kingdonia uniflora]|uniref:Uncharacterized protein n=1 Tax=Kingdonia uniflora TaxID=39325 RepID=A0A7J7P4N9_9MAGN|nr:hypothetical protein GIB67_040793 [Kingdonia uniflora]